MNGKTPQVGAQDPELKNSPIVWEMDDEQNSPGEPPTTGAACFFNGQSYATGAIVKSGTAVLRCDSGLWVPVGPADPMNP